QVVGGFARRLVVQAGAVDPQQFALLADAEVRVVRLDPTPPRWDVRLQIFFSPRPAPSGAGRSARRVRPAPSRGRVGGTPTRSRRCPPRRPATAFSTG